MTFGTVVGSSDQAKRMFRAALDAVAGMDAHVLMTTGAQMDLAALGAIPANVTLREFVPQNEILPHVEAVLCHGGSGTVLGALSTALPLVVTPIAADQPDNAKAVAGIGAGIEVPEPDSAAISDRVASVLSDTAPFAAGARHRGRTESASRHRAAQWSDTAISRTTPALLGLYSLTALWACDQPNCSSGVCRSGIGRRSDLDGC